jgi:hypothetical protein
MAAKLKIGKRGNEVLKKCSPLKQGRTAGHIFGREPSNDYFIKI